MDVSNGFRVSAESVTTDKAAAAADAVERAIGEIMAGKRKPGDMPAGMIVQLVQFARDSIEARAQMAAKWEAERERSIGLRHRILRAMSIQAEVEIADNIEVDTARDVLESLDAHLTADDWHAVEASHHPLTLGTLVLSAEGEADSDEHGNERFTGSCAVGEIVSADKAEGVTFAGAQTWTYGVTFGNGTHVLIESYELADPDAYLVANSPF